MKLQTYICMGALGLAALILGGCKSSTIAETTEIQAQRAQDLVVSLRNEKGELAMGQNRFIIAFRSASNDQPVNVGAVTVGAAMTMPGMAPMPAPIELEPAGATGLYAAKGNFAMSGSYKFEVRWDGPAGRGATSFNASVR